MGIYFACEKQPEHGAWGIYTRAKSSKVTSAFTLSTVCLDHGNAVTQAEALQKQFPNKHFSIQGAPSADQLPDKYQP